MQDLKETLKHIDSASFLGNITSLSLLGISVATIETALRFLCLIASLAVAWVTYRHTQEKRAELRERKKSAED